MTNLAGVYTAMFLILEFTASPHLHHGAPSRLNVVATFQKIPSPPKDTLVNYCALIRSAYFYGEKSVNKDALLSQGDIDHFNYDWKQVFNIESYQNGIGYKEFYSDHKFGEGKKDPFPPSNRYNINNPDTYLLFHLANEVGKIGSKTYEKCPECVAESINKINELLRNTTLHTQVSQLWFGAGTLKKITNVKEVTDFWQFLRCWTIDDRLNPENLAFFASLPPVVKCPDTTIIKCKNEIKPKVIVGYRHCEVGGKVDTIGPSLVAGIDNCPGSVYRYKFVARDFCFKKDSAYQFFIIKNDAPTISCPYDTIVECIEDLRIHHKLETTSSCSLSVSPSFYGPLLVSGTPNCPYSVYEMEYSAKDTCGRLVSCIQKITVQNDPPTIKCPPNRKVECEDDVQPEKIFFTTACGVGADLIIDEPELVKGKPNCPGAVYEIVYTLTDTCDRSISCTQQFTIENKGPKLIYPENQEVVCFEDIHPVDPQYSGACEMKVNLKKSKPVLVSGKHNCQGAIYQIVYTVTDECGRTDECTQLFTILKDEINITVPADLTVFCSTDIKPSALVVNKACKQDFKVTKSQPKLVSGRGDCSGSKYQVEYQVEDACGRTKKCVQNFIIENLGPEIACYPAMEIECNNMEEFKAPVPVVSCDVKYEMTNSGLILVAGKDKCDGAVYEITYTVKDICGRTAQCRQKFINHIPRFIISYSPKYGVDCESDIVSLPPRVTTSCNQTYRIISKELVLDSGIKNCPGAIYSIEHFIEDECGRNERYIQLIEISHNALTITCPPDRVVHCVEEIKKENLEVHTGCGQTEIATMGPVLESGKPDCKDAVYALTYILKDKCGRKAECVQKFTIIGDELQVTCPKDITVMSKPEIQADDLNLKVTSSCGKLFERFLDGPNLYSGFDNKQGAVYSILYTVADHCGEPKTCRQLFTVQGIPDCSSLYPYTEAVYNTQIKSYDCNCVLGYEWNADHTACELQIPDCKSFYPNTVAAWNTGLNKYVCDCMPGFYWNSTKTGCDAKPDCAFYYPNSEATFNQQTHQYECNCKVGYVWNADKTACVSSIPDCAKYYPNSEAVMNQQTQQYECNCKVGYVWNAGRTGCVSAIPDCSKFYPNSEAVMNQQTQQYECNCKAGYMWNTDKSGCVLSIPDCSQYYPNTVAVWNALKNEYNCDCKKGYVWNASRNGCTLPDDKSTSGEEVRYGPFTATMKGFVSTGLVFKKGGSFKTEATGTMIPKAAGYSFGPNGSDGWFMLRGKISEQRFDLGASGYGYVNVDGTLELGVPRVMNFLGDDQGFDGFFTVYVITKDAVRE